MTLPPNGTPRPEARGIVLKELILRDEQDFQSMAQKGNVANFDRREMRGGRNLMSIICSGVKNLFSLFFDF